MNLPQEFPGRALVNRAFPVPIQVRCADVVKDHTLDNCCVRLPDHAFKGHFAIGISSNKVQVVAHVIDPGLLPPGQRGIVDGDAYPLKRP